MEQLLVKKSKSNIICTLIQMLFLLIIIAVCVGLTPNTKNVSLIITLLIVLTSILGVVEIYFLTKKFFTPIMFFYLTVLLFHFGQIYLLALNIQVPYYDYKIMTKFYDDDIFNATIFCLYAVNALQLGFTVFVKEIVPIDLKTFYKNKSSTYKEINIYKIAIFLACVFLIPVLYYDFSRIFYVVQGMDYAEAFNKGFSGLIQISIGIFDFSLITLIISEENKRWKLLLFLKVFWELIKMVLIGNRGEPLMLIVTLLFVVLIFKKTLDKKEKIAILISGFIVFVLSGFVSIFRGMSNETNFIEAFIKTMKDGGIIGNFITECGTTMVTPMLTIMNIQYGSLGYVNGATYWQGLLILIPKSEFFFGEGFTNAISIGSVLNVLSPGYFLGGSIFAESYWNFGFIGGCIWMVVIGMLIAILQNQLYKSVASNNILLKSFLSMLFIGIFGYPRGYFYDVMSIVKMGVYSILIYELIYSFLLISRRGELNFEK